MKNIFKLIFLLVIITFILSCTSLNIKKEPIEIPFTLNENNQIVVDLKIKASEEENGKVLKCIVDTGSNSEMIELSQSGARIFYGEQFSEIEKSQKEYFRNNLENICGKKSSDVNDIEIEELYKGYGKLIQSKSKIHSCSLGSFLSKKIQYICYQGNGSPMDSDAIIGYKFFDNTDVLTINYKKKILIIDDYPINTVPIPLYFFKPTEKYFIPITINGENDFGIIDTGSEFFSIRHSNVDKELSNSILTKPTPSKIKKAFKILNNTDFEHTASTYSQSIKQLKISNVIFYDLEAIPVTNSNVETTSEFTKKLILSTNNLGYPVFKNSIIQFDFKRKLFYITE